jgi:hypothetical protein
MNAAGRKEHRGPRSLVAGAGLAALSALLFVRLLAWAGPGDVEAGPKISVSPDRYDFGAIYLPVSSETAAFTISNGGDAPLHIYGISITDRENYSIESGESGGQGFCRNLRPSIPPGSGCRVGVVFYPQSEGKFDARLVIRSNDPRRHLLRVPVTGIGVLPEDGGSLTLPDGPL